MLRLSLSNSRQDSHVEYLQPPLEVGRGPARSLPRLVVEDAFTSRDQLRIELESPGSIRITNLGGPVQLEGALPLASGQSGVVPLPTRLAFGYSTLELRWTDGPANEPLSLQTLQRPTLQLRDGIPAHSLAQLGASPSPETLMNWFEKLLSVQRAAAGSGEFYQQTARAVVELIGLDRGAVLLRRDEHWEVAASFATRTELQRPPSQRVLAQVLAEKRTFFESDAEHPMSQSLVGIEAIVASPILDEQDTVVGVLYGTRDARHRMAGNGISPLEAQVVQLLAGSISIGLARAQREAALARSRIQFEQFFSPELARALERNPSLLEGQLRDVTVLFADLRGFSGISERVGARHTYALLSDVLDRLTQRILEHGGVIIDYYGDGLAAMWNAPAEQPEHALKACEAARAMLGELPALNESWSPAIGCRLAMGIGINSGCAQVGNAGSHRRVKYGPRGHVVNLASRVEGATKLLGVSCLVTAFTQQHLPTAVPRRRLCQAQVTGILQPVHLFELPAQPDEHWQELQEQYEAALLCFERGDLAQSEQLCHALLKGPGRDDPPTRLLASRVEAHQANSERPFDCVFQLDTKREA